MEERLQIRLIDVPDYLVSQGTLALFAPGGEPIDLTEFRPVADAKRDFELRRILSEDRARACREAASRSADSSAVERALERARSSELGAAAMGAMVRGQATDVTDILAKRFGDRAYDQFFTVVIENGR